MDHYNHNFPWLSHVDSDVITSSWHGGFGWDVPLPPSRQGSSLGSTRPFLPAVWHELKPSFRSWGVPWISGFLDWFWGKITEMLRCLKSSRHLVEVSENWKFNRFIFMCSQPFIFCCRAIVRLVMGIEKMLKMASQCIPEKSTILPSCPWCPRNCKWFYRSRISPRSLAYDHS